MISLSDISCQSDTADDLCGRLEQFGVARLPGYLTSLQTERLLDEARTATERFPNYRNPYGPCSRFSLERIPPHLSRSRDLLDGSHLSPLPGEFDLAQDTINAKLFRNTTQAYLGPQCGFMEVVAFTRDWIPDRTAVYGKLHFDRRHQLKFIFYLNDVDASNGAFGCIPKSHGIGRQLFHREWRRTLDLDTDDVREIETSAAAVGEDQPEYRLVPCIIENMEAVPAPPESSESLIVAGPAGTLVVFDTHLLHFGGFVLEPGRERWTLKGHTFARR